MAAEFECTARALANDTAYRADNEAEKKFNGSDLYWSVLLVQVIMVEPASAR